MYGKQTTLRMDPALYAKLEQTARQQLRTISDMIRLILIEHIDEYTANPDRNRRSREGKSPDVYTPEGKPPAGSMATAPDDPGSETYRCENYIQAVTLQDNLHALTGKTYAIKADGQTGWLVTVSAPSDHR